MQSEGKGETLAQRINALAEQLGALAIEVADLERRQTERDQLVKAALSQISALSTNLRTLVNEEEAEPQAAPQPAEESPHYGEERPPESYNDQPRW